MENKRLDYFLSVLSPTGYSGYYNNLLKNEQGDVVLLKGTPGCGKSTLMKKIATYLLEKGQTVECIHCSLSPSSLDGVLCENYDFSMIDATPPHEIEPKYPIAYEQIMPLYYCLNAKKISVHRKEIIEKYTEKALLCDRALRYMAAAGSLLSDTKRTALTFTDIIKTQEFAKVISRKYLPCESKKNHTKPLESKRFLSALTQDGFIFYEQTIKKLAKNIMVLHDDYGCAAKHILCEVRKHALAKNIKIISCYCSMSPNDKIEHIIFPDLSFAIVTCNIYHGCTIKKDATTNVRNIHCERFCNKQSLALRKKRLQFNKKASKELLNQAQELLCAVGKCHAQIEQYYINAADFTIQNRAYEKIISQFE